MLSDAGGDALTRVVSVTFRLYAQRGGDVAVWTEIHPDTDVVDGVFNSVLGLRTAFDENVVGVESLYLGVQVGDDVEMTPRMRIGGVLKAQWAAVADHARDVRGEDIHPASVSIGNQLVIDAQGKWVGDPAGLRGPRGLPGEPGTPGVPGANGADGRPGRAPRGRCRARARRSPGATGWRTCRPPRQDP